jgi:type IV pilus assembly protein PilB
VQDLAVPKPRSVAREEPEPIPLEIPQPPRAAPLSLPAEPPIRLSLDDLQLDEPPNVPKPPPPSASFLDESSQILERPVQLSPQKIQEILRGTELFRNADTSVVASLAEHFKPFDYPAKTPMIRAGARAEWLGVIVEGQAQLQSVNAATGEGTKIETLKAGDLCGEAGVLMGSHSHGVVAESSVRLLRLGKAHFDQASIKVPGFAHAIARRLATRTVHLAMLGLNKGTAASAVPAPPVSKNEIPPGIIPYVDLAEFNLSPALINTVPPKLIQNFRLLPLQLRDRTLLVGMVNPKNVAAVAELKRVLTSVDIQVAAISMEDFGRALVQLKVDSQEGAKGKSIREISIDRMKFEVTDSEREDAQAVRVVGDEVVRHVSKIIATGLEREASDIHIEPDPSCVKVRYRVRGSLEDWNEFIPATFAKGIVARFKVLAGLDITERRLPQDGRIGLSIGSREIDLRMSTVPASRGEKIVLRVCESSSVLRALDQTYVEPTTLAMVRRAIHAHTGAVVIGGGTGSGKTASLYSMIMERRRARPDCNTLMAEDPIEYRLQGMTQIQINVNAGLTFPIVLRAMMRQDPDVIVIGETRDPDTCQIALEASLTGHLVFTSVHASDTISTFQRLESLGASRSLIGQALSVIVSQRLVPRLCGNCAKLEAPPPLLQESLATQGLIDRGSSVALPKAVGCDACGHTGIGGRVVLAEVLQITDEIRAALMADKTLADIQDLALESKVLFPYRQYASYLMSRKLISASDALLAVAR